MISNESSYQYRAIEENQGASTDAGGKSHVQSRTIGANLAAGDDFGYGHLGSPAILPRLKMRAMVRVFLGEERQRSNKMAMLTKTWLTWCANS